jgi:hypothetical protein
VSAQSLSRPGSCWREFFLNPLQLCDSAACIESKNEYIFWMATADIPDESNVGDWYPDSLTYNNQGNEEEIKKYIRYINYGTLTNDVTASLSFSIPF